MTLTVASFWRRRVAHPFVKELRYFQHGGAPSPRLRSGQALLARSWREGGHVSSELHPPLEPHAFPSSSGPLGLNLHYALHSCRIVSEAGGWPALSSGIVVHRHTVGAPPLSAAVADRVGARVSTGPGRRPEGPFLIERLSSTYRSVPTLSPKSGEKSLPRAQPRGWGTPC